MINWRRQFTEFVKGCRENGPGYTKESRGLKTIQQLATHNIDVIMSAMASQITGVSIVCSTAGSGGVQRKHQSSAPLAFVRGIHRWPVNSPHKSPVTRKMFPSDDVIMMGKTLRVLIPRPLPLKWRNTLRPYQNCHHFTDDIVKCITVCENNCVLIQISLPFVPSQWSY